MIRKFLKIDGIETKIEVTSTEEAEDAEYVLCVRKNIKSIFDDDEFGLCSICGREIRFRPHMPKKPKKICIECLFEKIKEEQ